MEADAAAGGRMADGEVTSGARARATAALDRVLSALLRYDLSRTDVVKWVYFARQVLALMLISLVSVAAMSAYTSTRQAQELLRESLESEARAIAGAVARAAFVPLELEDERALKELAASYASVERMGLMRISDGRGRVRAEMVRVKTGARLMSVREAVVPLQEVGEGRAPRVAGAVEVGLRTDWIDAKVREIALTNAALSGIISLAVLLLGALVVGNLVERTRELVGEARLTAEVKRANAELEAFSYSVAHDLRAPLRAADGFSQLLLEDYADKLDEDGKDYLRRMRAASRRMGQLIDDLLNLSRVTRGELRRERVDLGRLARETVERLRQAEPARAVEWRIADGLWADADPNLLRALFENLLGNAWKYTSKHPRALIEFGAARADGRAAYFVRDDGAGFDMAYASKLFQPFSRLHSPGQFEGTGIGLATVSRIVVRHGGRVWAESAVEKGTTVYFTLKERP